MSDSTIDYVLSLYPEGKDLYNNMNEDKKSIVKRLVFWVPLLIIMLLITFLPMPYNEYLRIWFHISIIVVCIKVVFTGKPLDSVKGIFLKIVFLPFIVLTGITLYTYLKVNKKRYGSRSN